MSNINNVLYKFAYYMFTILNVKIEDDSNNENFIFSPFSLHNLLSMIYNGAKNKTNQELTHIFSENTGRNVTVEIVNKDNFDIVNSMKKEVEDGDINIIIDNFLFSRNEISLNPNFVQNLAKFYNIYSMKFDTKNLQEFLDFVKEGISVSTNNLMPNLLTNIPPNTDLILLNILYFKGLWDKKFDKQETTIEPFYISQKMIDVDMMHTTCKCNYYETEKFKACKLFYKGKKFSFTIFLPKDGIQIREIELLMTNEKIFNLLNSPDTERNVSLHLPKFKISSRNDLHDLLKSFGLEDLADGDASDLCNMLVQGNLCNVKFEQKAIIEVNEEGCEAAAATSMVAFLSLLPTENYVEMNVNRNFCFSLDYQKDEHTSIPLFMGTITNPKKH